MMRGASTERQGRYASSGKLAVNRHQTQSKATADRLERGFEKQLRQTSKAVIEAETPVEQPCLFCKRPTTNVVRGYRSFLCCEACED